MPSKSSAQHKLMEIATHTPGGYGGVPQSVGKEFVKADSDGKAQCAGLLILNGNKVFLVHRTDRDEWEGPGGHIESGETPLDAAIRESIEEIGVDFSDSDINPEPMMTGNDEVNYQNFIVNTSKDFDVKLNNEHDKAGWFDKTNVPDTTHPGVKKILGISRADSAPTELTIAKQIQSGELPSPQKYENIHLFDVRVTGTGTAYRDSRDEYVYRPPENFLTDEFVERCNGLPLIFEHPESILNTDEFRNRSIGVIILPYIKGDEVWGIAKVFDDDAAELMQTSHASTSPAVVFRNAGSTETLDIEGETVLIEGKPSYLDHLAICETGAWDKGGEPKGIAITNQEETKMEEDEKMPAWADAIMKRLDSIESARADSEEKEDGKKEEAKADSDGEVDKEIEETKGMVEAGEGLENAMEAHKSENNEEDKALEYADSLKKENADLRARIEAMDAKINVINKPISSADRDVLAKAQSRADSLAQMFGEEISAPLYGESPIAYRKRLADKFKKHSKELAGIKLDSMDEVSFGVIEERIYADAMGVARSPSVGSSGRLIPVVRKDSAGREITTYYGDSNEWLNPFKGVGMKVKIDRTAGKGV